MPAIPRGKQGQWSVNKTLGAFILEKPEQKSSDSGNEYDSDPEILYSEHWASDEELKEEGLIPNPSLCDLGF